MGECEECKKTEGEQRVQRKACNSRTPAVAPPIVHQVLNSPGHALDAHLSAQYRRFYGRNFDAVRIHADNEASASARSVNALAYTVGNHVVFAQGQYAPDSRPGARLLAHEMAHVAQQETAPILRCQPDPNAPTGSNIRPVVDKFIHGQATAQEKKELQQLLMADQLNEAEMDALKQFIGRSIVDAVMQQALPGSVNIAIGGPQRSVHTFFKARLKLHVSGALRAVAAGFEGTLETTAEVWGDNTSKKVNVTITPPEGDTMLAEMVRTKVFSHGELRFELGESALKVLNAASISGEISILITGKKNAKSGGLIISLPDVPDDVELEVGLSQSAEKPELAPATGAPAKPPARAFVTGGVVSDPRQTGAGVTAGLDVPVGTDTKNPLIYLGFGLRAGADTRGGLHAGGAVFSGLNLNPVTLQLAFDAGIARLPRSQTSGGTDPKTAAYFGVEGSVGVRVSKRVEVMALVSIIGEPSGKGAGSAQVGAGFNF